MLTRGCICSRLRGTWLVRGTISRWLWSTLLGRRSSCSRASVSIATPSMSLLNISTFEYEPERVDESGKVSKQSQQDVHEEITTAA